MEAGCEELVPLADGSRFLGFTFIFMITFIFYSETWSDEQCCDPGDYPLGQVSFHRESAIWLKFKKSNKVYTENQQFG